MDCEFLCNYTIKFHKFKTWIFVIAEAAGTVFWLVEDGKDFVSAALIGWFAPLLKT